MNDRKILQSFSSFGINLWVKEMGCYGKDTRFIIEGFFGGGTEGCRW